MLNIHTKRAGVTYLAWVCPGSLKRTSEKSHGVAQASSERTTTYFYYSSSLLRGLTLGSTQTTTNITPNGLLPATCDQHTKNKTARETHTHTHTTDRLQPRRSTRARSILRDYVLCTSCKMPKHLRHDDTVAIIIYSTFGVTLQNVTQDTYCLYSPDGALLVLGRRSYTHSGLRTRPFVMNTLALQRVDARVLHSLHTEIMNVPAGAATKESGTRSPRSTLLFLLNTKNKRKLFPKRCGGTRTQPTECRYHSKASLDTLACALQPCASTLALCVRKRDELQLSMRFKKNCGHHMADSRGYGLLSVPGLPTNSGGLHWGGLRRKAKFCPNSFQHRNDSSHVRSFLGVFGPHCLHNLFIKTRATS